jgi:hypothetical protein
MITLYSIFKTNRPKLELLISCLNIAQFYLKFKGKKSSLLSLCFVSRGISFCGEEEEKCALQGREPGYGQEYLLSYWLQGHHAGCDSSERHTLHREVMLETLERSPPRWKVHNKV